MNIRAANTKTEVNNLWHLFRTAINSAYDEAQKESKTGSAYESDGLCLRDYAENISWSDNLSALLGRESANERRHRSNRPSVPGFSVETAAKLLLMTQAANGAGFSVMPKATGLLVFRQTAIEAQVIGFLAQKYLTREWCDAVHALDYAKLMKGGE